MKPPIPITDRRFQYVPSASTDLRKTFARVRDELAAVKAIGGPSQAFIDAMGRGVEVIEYEAGSTRLPANVKALPKKKGTA